VYFEYIIRPKPAKIILPLEILISALQAEGCQASLPRYPLLHQQPFFTEGQFKRINRLGVGGRTPQYDSVKLPRTEQSSKTIMRLPSFPNAEKEILDQYIRAFEKVVEHQDLIRETIQEKTIEIDPYKNRYASRSI
jgi:dTDP-4-amino-4,6-dideoxygalactose transaminase